MPNPAARAVSPRSLLRPALLCLGALLAACTGSGPERTDDWKRAEIASRCEAIHARFPQVAETSAAQALALYRRGGALFVDDRDPVERAVSMLPGAVGVGEFLADPAMAGGRAVVVYCTIGERSAKRVADFAARGIAAENLDGGILAWTHEHGPLLNPLGAPTRRVHVYSRSWNLAASDYEPVW